MGVKKCKFTQFLLVIRLQPAWIACIEQKAENFIWELAISISLEFHCNESTKRRKRVTPKKKTVVQYLACENWIFWLLFCMVGEGGGGDLSDRFELLMTIKQLKHKLAPRNQRYPFHNQSESRLWKYFRLFFSLLYPHLLSFE